MGTPDIEDWDREVPPEPRSGGLAPVLLIAANVIVTLYVWIAARPEPMISVFRSFGLVPGDFHPHALVTSMFLHGGFMHLVGNMYFLGVLGGSLDGLLGRNKFLALYFVSGIIAGLAQVAAQPDVMIPIIGASGAIAGLMGATVVKLPTKKINLLALMGAIWMVAYRVEAPAGVLLIAWLALQAFWLTVAPGGVAWVAHIAGFGAGVVLVKILTRESRRNESRVVAREDWH